MCAKNGRRKGVGEAEIGKRHISTNIGSFYPAESQGLAGTEAAVIKEVTNSSREARFVGCDIDKRSVETRNVIAGTPFFRLQV